MTVRLKKGTLFSALCEAEARARSSGALVSIPTGHEFVEDAGVLFLVRIIANLTRKEEEKKTQREASKKGGQSNPFLPYEKALFVADVSETHLALLNKFNVVDRHLLIVTKAFESQEELLTPHDFEALLSCMSEYDSLGFYNGGETAGASQLHKHLQLVPLPLAPQGPAVPIESALSSAVPEGGIGEVSRFPFVHAFVRFSGNRGFLEKAPTEIVALYHQMLRHCGQRVPEGGRGFQSGPYCLLVTRSWMLLVPRSTEFFQGISINSLGFAGAMLVRNEREMELLKRQGPMTALREVALARFTFNDAT